MSATARNYAFIVRMDNENKKEKAISKEKVEECKKMVEPYLSKSNGQKN